MSTKYLQLITVFTILLTVSSTSPYVVESGGFPNYDSTESEAETNCTKFYRALATKLLENDTNYFNLQMTFFPPNGTSPDFVIVKYSYEVESEMDALALWKGSKVWFWSSAVYFFYHPIRVFQFTSFVFSDPLLQLSEVTLHLPAECLNVSDAYMKLLTQRVSQPCLGTSSNNITHMQYYYIVRK